MLVTGHSSGHNGLSQYTPVLELTSVETRWLAPSEQHSALRLTSDNWFRHIVRPPTDNLGRIRRSVWEAQCGLQPFPEIAMAAGKEEAIGVMSGYQCRNLKYFFIENIALHPRFTSLGQEMLMIAEKLIGAAMDASVETGCYGWLAVTPEDSALTFWGKLGFYKYDNFTYRKLGYFS